MYESCQSQKSCQFEQVYRCKRLRSLWKIKRGIFVMGIRYWLTCRPTHSKRVRHFTCIDQIEGESCQQVNDEPASEVVVANLLWLRNHFTLLVQKCCTKVQQNVCKKKRMRHLISLVQQDGSYRDMLRQYLRYT